MEKMFVKITWKKKIDKLEIKTKLLKLGIFIALLPPLNLSPLIPVHSTLENVIES